MMVVVVVVVVLRLLPRLVPYFFLLVFMTRCCQSRGQTCWVTWSFREQNRSARDPNLPTWQRDIGIGAAGVHTVVLLH